MIVIEKISKKLLPLLVIIVHFHFHLLNYLPLFFFSLVIFHLSVSPYLLFLLGTTLHDVNDLSSHGIFFPLAGHDGGRSLHPPRITDQLSLFVLRGHK